jgi:hypothetical protein
MSAFQENISDIALVKLIVDENDSMKFWKASTPPSIFHSRIRKLEDVRVDKMYVALTCIMLMGSVKKTTVTYNLLLKEYTATHSIFSERFYFWKGERGNNQMHAYFWQQ